MISNQAFSGVRADAVAMSLFPWLTSSVMPAVASAHRAGWALAAIDPQHKRRTAAATSTSVKRGTI